MHEFPIGQALTGVAVLEDKEFGGHELCLDKVQLNFQNRTVTLLPLSDTDEIEIIQEASSNAISLDIPLWCKSFIAKKLRSVWVCENDQGYRDQVIFAFEYLRPSISFVAEGSVLKVFCYEQINRVQEFENNFQHTQVS
ncbi:MAG: DUF6334 family protein [Scytonema sp. PMC 1069.18]|nr:DUF6334 family protein [Scytonema sp. PMC 1069.18]